MMFRYLILSFSFLYLLAPSVVADFQTGGDAYKKGDYKTAAEEFLPLAEKGDHRAMFALGSMYAAGNGVPQDFKQAMTWFKKAAKYGRPDAQFKIGVMYAQGFGVETDYKKALNWFGKAARQGYPLAQYQLGVLYAGGLGVSQDDIKAYAWLNTALMNGVMPAKEVLTSVNDKLNDEQRLEAEELSKHYLKTYRGR